MKKLLLAIALVLTISISASAQSDGFFRDGGNEETNRTGTMPLLPGYGVGATNDDQTANAPLGSGLIVLTALGAGYAVKRVKSRE